jgi:hypothetical protein
MGEFLFSILWGVVSHIPWQVWGVLALCIVAALFVVRYVTDWHVVIPVIIAFFICGQVLAWRAHWIELGRDEALAKATRIETVAKVDAQKARDSEAGYRKTEGLIQDCYARNRNVTYLWDRTVGQCLRTDGALERMHHR